MSKMRSSVCPTCKRPIHRHDPNRIQVRVADSTRGEGVFKEYHLSCHQEKEQ